MDRRRSIDGRSNGSVGERAGIFFPESLIAAAERQGLTPAAARTLVLNTALGAARMAIADGSDDPAILRQRVTSPGGTTQAALERLEAGGFRDLVDVAVVRATERGRELSNQFGA